MTIELREKPRQPLYINRGNLKSTKETKLNLSEKWKEKLDKIDFAFQPIINPFTVTTFAVEALIRNVETCGFESIAEFFNTAYYEKQLFFVDIELRKKAIKKFCSIDFYKKIKLFYNYDPRILEMDDYRLGETEAILQQYSIKSDQICFELNEKYHIHNVEVLKNFLEKLRERGIYIAVDDFGTGFAWFELFYHSNPDFLKIDRFLISEIDKDIKKKSFCLHIISLCEALGVTVLAEGVETEKEFLACKDAGFDLVQGYYIQKPTKCVEELKYTYSEIKGQVDKRKFRNDFQLISKEIIRLETLNVNDDVKDVFDKFHDELSYNFFPIVDSTGFPLGIIHEKTIKHYVYSPYGKDLLLNKSVIKSLQHFVTDCPVVDIKTKQDKILEIFVNNPESEGVIITENLKYIGFLTAKSLLNILNEKNISYARETNPLTKLPGNILINQYIQEAIENSKSYHYFLYYDIDNFKPFNDKFGFRQGDRIITLFAELLKKFYYAEGFLGHVGGDDFFVGLQKDVETKNEILFQTTNLINTFTEEIVPFYSNEEIANGYYTSADRNGEQKRFDLLSVSVAVVEISKDAFDITQDDISTKLAGLKKEAKNSNEKIAFLFK